MLVSEPNAESNARLLGELKGKVDSILATSERTQNAILSLIQSMETDRREWAAKFDALRERVESEARRIDQQDHAADAIEGHGAAISSIENDLEDFKIEHKSQKAVADNNRFWIKCLLGTVGVLLGDTASGHRLSAFIRSVFGGG